MKDLIIYRLRGKTTLRTRDGMDAMRAHIEKNHLDEE